ncbi:hypothetical protein Nepgr_021953 [Nepenthes gracilis]|uniref:Uncharacterized protein n=1 Tax=Nepenthes gracilis TaxID=150966 RepID=A0AAD3XWD1_NEPGR|nr:hypothetical protein Nepgr_021953 [Nepenthes gracilis]
MVISSQPKSPNYLHVFCTNSPSSAMKSKTLIHNIIFSHICRVIRALSKAAKSIFLEILREYKFITFRESHLTKKNKYRNNKLLFGSFRLHYNWCSSSSSSHVMPMPPPSPAVDGLVIGSTKTLHLSGDYSTWNSAFSDKDQFCKIDKEDAELSSYLQWLEEKGVENSDRGEDVIVFNEIDKLADLFIANCHEKFRLEKIESYRKYQEMLARST